MELVTLWLRRTRSSNEVSPQNSIHKSHLRTQPGYSIGLGHQRQVSINTVCVVNKTSSESLISRLTHHASFFFKNEGKELKN